MALLTLFALPVLRAETPSANAVPADDDGKAPLERRAERERQWRREGFPLIPHRLNYFLPVTYNTSPHDSSGFHTEHTEAKYQFSVKVLLWDNIAQTDLHLYFAYTQLAMWEVYNHKQSAPFRDTNHEPELFLSWDMKKPLWGATLRRLDAGFDHQSNGVSEPNSRSWNRIFAQAVYDWEPFAFTVRPWYRVPEARHDDDNPDIDKYMGYGEFTVEYFRRNHVLSLMMRDNLRTQNKGALQLEYSFPLTRNLTGLIQYFTGYGESLIDYNRPNNRISVGIALGRV